MASTLAVGSLHRLVIHIPSMICVENKSRFDRWSVIKMLRKHEVHIINYFRHGATNANAERINSKIQRFITQNYGLKDKDFFLYRTTGYFS
jgi:hypothetical protein